MKNKFKILIIIFFLINNISFANEFIFKTQNLEIIDNGKLISAGKGKAISKDNDLEINADRFEYDDDLKILKTFGNGYLRINSKNLEANFDDSIINRKNFNIQADGNVKIFDEKNKITLETENIIYNQEENIIKSDIESRIKDENKNDYKVDKFNYKINNNLLKVENLIHKDIQGNILKTSVAFINTDTNRLFGKDININLSNKSFNKENDPRLKGNSIVYENNTTTISKGVFTTCKKRDNCPPWQLSSEKIQHDKKKKIINYDNAVLRIYDFPVMYFPKFFHPDPTVKRQTGFLIPSIKNSTNSSDYLNTPYFFAISENKDATFSPRFYSEDQFLLQTEYRQANLNSNHHTDFSYFIKKDKNSKNHFFYKLDKKFNLTRFNENKLDLKIQKTSNDTYLKKNNIISNIVADKDVLENSINLDLYSNDMSINLESTVYEDLNKNSSDRYEYILPKIDVAKKIENRSNLNGEFTFKSQNLIRNFNTNIFEKSNINDLIFKSFPKITKMGFYNNYELIIKNSNTDGKNSSNFKNNSNIYLSSLFQLNSSLPLINENDKHQKIFKPKVSLKVAPSHTKNERDKSSKIDINNILSVNRATDNDYIEGGISLIYGSDFSIYQKNNSKEILSFKFANNLRFDENKNLPVNNQIGQKTSNFFTETILSPNEFINLKYNSAVKNNLSDIAYENLITEFKVNNFVTTFDYLNENNTKDKNSYITNTTKYILDESNSLSFSTRENKTSDLTEYYNLMYQYKNDCLAASIEYNKDYYNDRDLKPTESIFFKLTIIPFGETSSPNLKN